MPRSSLGFHTMSLSLRLSRCEYLLLIRDFKKYSHDTGLIRMYHVDGRGNYLEYRHSSDDSLVPINLRVSYYREDRGIKWLMRDNARGQESRSYIVEVTINPKILGGIHDYITAATYEDMPAAIENFNHIAQSISPLLQSFDYYRLTRIDYCINFALDELAPGCDPELMVNLIKRSNIPHHYEEWTEYDDKAHRKKSRPGSFYLTSSSININCYSKYMQLLEKSRENKERGLPPVSQATLDAARYIIRFEVQCKYNKTFDLSRDAVETGNHNYNKYESLLSYETCNEIINHYFAKTIGKKDWWTLQHAVNHIIHLHYNKQKETRLIEALQLINHMRSVSKAKSFYQGKELKAFKQTLKDLSWDCNINPVTIPKEWGIKHIPNLLYAYYDKIEQEKSEEEIKKFREECFNEYIKKHGHLPK